MVYDTGTLKKAQQESISTPRLHKYVYIDILRGLAILGVIAVHTGQQVEDLNAVVASIFNYGQMGVQLFFVASAITLCLSSAQRKEGSVFNFYVRRFFRIAPLFYLAILFYFLWRAFLQYQERGVFAIPDNYSIRAVLETVFFVHGFDPKNYNFVVPGGWSIAAEMSFYAVFPLLYLVQSRYKKTEFLLISAFVFVACLLVKMLFIYGLQGKLMEKGLVHTFVLEYDFLNKSLLNQISVFLVGIACYQYISDEDNSRYVSNKMAALSLPLVISSFFLLNSKSYTHTPFTGLLYPVLSAMAFALISMRLSAVIRFNGLVPKIMVKVGQLSFSMYILHFFVLDLVVFIFQKSIYAFVGVPELRLALLYPAVLLVTFLFSTITYNTVEKRGVEIGGRLIRKINQ
jgi:peptidoglycan/LPS O-acetylase OafA/YrhL